jgi:hypothetical protein
MWLSHQPYTLHCLSHAESSGLWVCMYAGIYAISVSTGGSLLAGMPRSVEFGPMSPPNLLSAKMSNTQGSIYVFFDEPTDQGEFEGNDLCSLLLSAATVAKLGTSADDVVCSWVSDGGDSYLEIALGTGATIVPSTPLGPGDSIEIKENAIRNLAQNSYYVTGSTVVLPPDSPMPVSAVLSGPAEVGICDRLLLYAGNSAGAGTRALTFEYSITSTNGEASRATAAIALQNALKDQSTIYISYLDLEVGATYTITLTVSNILGASDSASIVTTKTSNSLPIASISNPELVEVFQSDEVELVVEAVQPFQCELADATMDLRCALGF